jgi:hypothetical protein
VWHAGDAARFIASWDACKESTQFPDLKLSHPDQVQHRKSIAFATTGIRLADLEPRFCRDTVILDNEKPPLDNHF